MYKFLLNIGLHDLKLHVVIFIFLWQRVKNDQEVCILAHPELAEGWGQCVFLVSSAACVPASGGREAVAGTAVSEACSVNATSKARLPPIFILGRQSAYAVASWTKGSARSLTPFKTSQSLLTITRIITICCARWHLISKRNLSPTHNLETVARIITILQPRKVLRLERLKPT